ncbi:MAG TPA: DUF4331 domain-containing protein [Burkholderiaceae bacterium]|nr:DUF4331 domain-containing protein [Burkholderiaceae bacterium]
MATQRPRSPRLIPLLAAIGAIYGFGAAPAQASSHREAPSITTTPKVDATDFYMFNSYEAGRTGFVTLIANYLPLQDAYGGPNYFKMDPNALYEIHIDNVGDAKEHITFQFQFQNALKGKTLSVGGKDVAIPLTQFGQVTDATGATLNVTEAYTVNVVRGDRRGGTKAALTNAAGGSATFAKPSDNIGTKTIPNYASYVAPFVYSVNIPGCGTPGKVFAGQRKDPFAVNLGTIFDLVHAPASFLLDPANKDAGTDDLKYKNVTTLALEVPTSCLTAGSDPVIGGWTTASLRQGSLQSGSPKSGYQTAAVAGGAWTQVSRLGMPLVNEVVIGLPDKDKFNASKPKDDGQFANYVTNPTLPALLEIALAAPNIAPTNFPRTDLVTTFLTGIKGVNQQGTVTASEMLRLNTAIAPTAYASQNRLGLLGGLLGPAPQDLAGYPNGRRPNDDVVDISLIAVMGGLCVANGDADTYKFGATCKPSAVPLGTAVFGLHDGVDQAGQKVKAAGPLLAGFPYIGLPIPGAQ